MRFSDDQATAKIEFAREVNALCTYAKEQRKRGTPLSPLRRTRLARVLCERYMRHSVATWGPDVIDLVDGDADFVGEHRAYAYAPHPYQLQRLADIMLQE